MSLAETQELMRTMQELISLLQKVEKETDKVIRSVPETKSAIGTKRQALRLINQLNTAFALMGLPRDIQTATGIIQKIIFLMNALFISIKLVEEGTVLGRVVGVIGIALTAYSAVSIGSPLEGY